MNSESLPKSPWEKLFPRALALIDEISLYGGVKDPSGLWLGHQDETGMRMKCGRE